MSEIKYFAARNAPEGFCSYFPEIFSPDTLDLIYIIKGGPGTGKSTMMKKIGSAVQAAGYGVEYYYCSSDPDSLDGIKIPELSAAVLDGTSPHMTDSKYPGAVERIVNLCEFFDNDRLKKNAKSIRELSAAQSVLYVRAYSSLRVAGELRGELDLLLEGAVLREKLSGAVSKLVSAYAGGDSIGGSSLVRCQQALSTKGNVKFDTFEALAKTKYAVGGITGVPQIFLSEVKRALCEKGIDVLYSPECDGEKPNSLYIPAYRISFETVGRITPEVKEKYEKVINASRFIDKKAIRQLRNRIRFVNKTKALFISNALEALSQVAPLHQAIEKIYISAVDFSGIDRMTQAIIGILLKK